MVQIKEQKYLKLREEFILGKTKFQFKKTHEL